MDTEGRDRITVATTVGPLGVESIGSGPPAVFWHSLFVDDRSWHRVLGALAAERRALLITGPGHGTSGDPGHPYSMEDCATAAVEVLDALGVEGPVDWVGNAWGGHVGMVLAARRPELFRTLVTVGTPVHAYSPAARLRTRVLYTVYRRFGPTRYLRDQVVQALLSARTRDEDPAALNLVRECFMTADRAGLANAVWSISLQRPDLTGLLPSIPVPTLMATGAEHPEWTPERAASASRALPQGSTAVLEGTAWLSPLEAPEAFSRLVIDFWAAHPPVQPPPGATGAPAPPDPATPPPPAA